MGAAITGSNGYSNGYMPRPVRLVSVLLASLAAILVLRGVGVLVSDAGGLSSDLLHGFASHGRYYPVDKICSALDPGALQDAVRDGGQLAGSTTVFEATTDHVIEECQFQNKDVVFTFSAGVYPDAAMRDDLTCTPDNPGEKVETITVGRYTACRWQDVAEGGILIVDDNAVVGCKASPTDVSSLPALQPAVQRNCVRLVDELAAARPAPYWGNRFWTIL